MANLQPSIDFAPAGQIGQRITVMSPHGLALWAVRKLFVDFDPRAGRMALARFDIG
jgi:hypothetical protein